MNRLMNSLKYLTFAVTLLTTNAVVADIRVTDDAGNLIRLAKPAQRIVSLAPHLTEVLFAVGAGQKLVGVVQFSDYPPAAKDIQQVGGYTKLDLEAIIALQPDLVVAWKSGNNNSQIEKLQKFGMPVYYNEPHSINDIAVSLQKLGRLAGTEQQANQAAKAFRDKYQKLEKTYRHRPVIRGFYQVWNQPLITINGQHLISDVLQLCGVQNIFAELPVIAPRISVEAVLAQDPQMIIASGMDKARPEWLDDWRKWHKLQAVRTDNLYFVPPSIIQRHAPRILDAAQQICEQAEQARKNYATLKD